MRDDPQGWSIGQVMKAPGVRPEVSFAPSPRMMVWLENK